MGWVHSAVATAAMARKATAATAPDRALLWRSGRTRGRPNAAIPRTRAARGVHAWAETDGEYSTGRRKAAAPATRRALERDGAMGAGHYRHRYPHAGDCHRRRCVRRAGAGRGLVPERRDLPRPPQGVGGTPSLALSRVRDPAGRARQHPRRVVGAPARALPHVW